MDLSRLSDVCFQLDVEAYFALVEFVQEEQFYSIPCWVQGLITKARKDLDPAAAPFARGFGPGEIEGLGEGASLLEVVSLYSGSSLRPYLGFALHKQNMQYDMLNNFLLCEEITLIPLEAFILFKQGTHIHYFEPLNPNSYTSIYQVKRVKPHVLLGLSGVGGIFDEQVIVTTSSSLSSSSF